MRYLVTGATGFIGGRLARRLVAEGHRVVTIARDPGRAGDLVALGVEVHRGDITDRASLDRPMAGVDGLFHVAAWYRIGARDGGEGRRINVDGTRNVLEAMRAAGVKKGVYTSTLAVFGDTHGKRVDEGYFTPGPFDTEYERTKWAAHYQVAVPMMEQGLPLVIVQPGLVYGPGDTSSVRVTLHQFLRRRLSMLPERTAYCWAHVDDTVTGHLLAMEKGRVGESYIIAGPPHTLVEAMALASRLSGVPVPRMRASPLLLRAMAGVMDVVGRFVALPGSYTSEGLRVIAGTTYLGDNAKARRELGYAPRPLEEGLRETLLHEMKELGLEPPRASGGPPGSS